MGMGNPWIRSLATADGEVVYVNTRTSASNYGIYVVIRHRFGRDDVYTFSGHLASASVKTGETVKAGDLLAFSATPGGESTSIAPISIMKSLSASRKATTAGLRKRG
jgi:hypothetical protein